MAWIHNNVVLPLVDKTRHKGLGGRLRQLEKFEKASPKRQHELQAEMLKQLLQHAYDSTPYYRRLFDEASFHPFE